MSLKSGKEILERIDQGVRGGVAKALAEHKRAGRSIWVSREGQVVEIPPEQIQVPVMQSDDAVIGKKNPESR